jgi:hypothetical protein
VAQLLAKPSTWEQVTTLGRKRVEDLPAADGYEHINLAQAEAQERLVQKARAAACLRCRGVRCSRVETARVLLGAGG